MKLKKLREYEFNNNDIYILETFGNKIIINNNENGLIFLDSYFKLHDSANLDQSVYIYSVFKNFINNKILLYCPDEKTLIYYQCANNKFSFIPLKNFNQMLSKCYYWKNDICIIVNYDLQFYTVDFDKTLLKRIPQDSVQIYNQLFYNFCTEIKKYEYLYQINGIESNFIFCDQETNKVIYYDYLNSYKKVINKPAFDYHDLIYTDEIFVFIAETKIEVIFDNLNIKLYPDTPDCIFLKACFVKENEKKFLVILSSYKGNNKHTKLISYSILI